MLNEIFVRNDKGQVVRVRFARTPVTRTQARRMRVYQDVDIALDAAPNYPQPMLATAKPSEVAIEHYGNHGWMAEQKIDGRRLMLHVDDGKVVAWPRPHPGRPRSHVAALPLTVQLPDGIYDSELSDGTLFLFDLLEAGDYTTRRRRLERAFVPQPRVQLVPQLPCTTDSYEFILSLGGEGVMLKDPASPYLPGVRSAHWLKVKPADAETFTLVGFHGDSLILRDRSGTEIAVDPHTNIDETSIGRTVVVKYARERYRYPRVDWEQTRALWRRRG